MDPNAQPPHTEFVNLNKDFRNTIFGSVGCFILKTYTQPTAGGFTTKAPINVQGMITNIMVSTKEIKDASQAPPMSPACEFREERCFAYGTGFLIKKIDEKNLIIATAGHCVLKEEKNPQGICEVKDTVAQSFFAFGATLDVSTNIPTESVWGIDRVIYGQNERFKDMFSGSDGVPDWSSLDDFDRPDWALVRLTSLGPSMVPRGGPVPLEPSTTLKDETTGVMIVGHPWGTALKISNFKGEPRAMIKTKVPYEKESGVKKIRGEYPLANVFKHNARATKGNSGSPVFTEEKKVIGIHASGKGEHLHKMLYTYGLGKKTLEPYWPPTNEIVYFKQATKNDVWTPLIDPNSQIRIVFKVFDKHAGNNQGKVTVLLRANTGTGDDSNLLVTSVPAADKPQQVWVTLPPTVAAWDLTKILLSYQPSDVPTAKPRSQSVELSRLQVVCTNPKDEDPSRFVTLYDLGDKVTSLTETLAPAYKARSALLMLGPWIDKAWKNEAMLGPRALNQAFITHEVTASLVVKQ